MASVPTEASYAFLRQHIGQVYPQLNDAVTTEMVTRLATNPKLQTYATNMLGRVSKSDVSLPNVVVQGNISPDHLSYLTRAFSGIVNFTARPTRIHSTHALMKAMRQAAALYQFSLLQGFSNKSMIVAGENYQWLSKNAKNFKVVACVSPNLSPRDDATRNLIVRGMKKQKNDNDIPFHSCRLEDLDYKIKASVIFARDVYDMGLEERVKAADKAGAVVFSYSLIVPRDFYSVMNGVDYTKTHQIDSTGATFRFSKDKKFVHFEMGDGSRGYTHSVKTYESCIRSSSTTTPYATYHNSMVGRAGCYAVFHIRRVSKRIRPPRYLVEQVSTIKTVKVEVLKYKGTGPLTLMSSYHYKHFITIPEADFNRIVTTILSEYKVSGSGLLQDTLRIYNGVIRSSYIVDSVTRRQYPVSATDVPMLMTSILCHVLRLKAISTERVKDSTDATIIRRQLSEMGYLEIYNPKNLLHYLVNSVRLGVTAFKNVLKHSPFVRELIDLFSLQFLDELFCASEMRDFSPKIIRDDTTKVFPYLRNGLRYDHRVDYDIPDFERNSSTFEQVAFETSSLGDGSVEELDRAFKQSDDILVEVEDTSGVEFDQKAFHSYRRQAIEELQLVLLSDIADAEISCVVTRDLFASVPVENYENTVMETWSDASNDKQRVVLFHVISGQICTSFPVGEPIEGMYAVPLESLVYKLNDTYALQRSYKVNDHISLADGHYFINDNLRILPQIRIMKTLTTRSSLVGVERETRVILHEAVAGHGKTYKLVNEIYQKGSLVLCSGRKNREELYVDFKKKLGEDSQIDFLFTIDSYLMNPNKRSLTLIVDECFLAAYGKIALLQDLASIPGKPLKLILIGDRPQIQYIDRGSVHTFFQGPNPNSSRFFHEVNMGIDSKRISLQQCHQIKDAYPREVYTTSTVRHAMAFSRISSIEDVPIFQNTLYTTFTQMEKTMLKKYFSSRNFNAKSNVREKGVSLLTVHESQGDSVSVSILVRLNTSNQVLFDSPPHRLVVQTRATHGSIYMSVRVPKEDKLTCAYLDSVTDQELDARIYKGSDAITIHTDSDCSCGGSSHEALPLLRQLRAMNDVGEVNPGVSRFI